MKIISYFIIGMVLCQICIVIRNPKLVADSKNWAHKNVMSECVSKIFKFFGCSVYDAAKMLIDILRLI